MSYLRIGTCSWKYPSWNGLVYSAPKGIDYLAEYSRKYNTVEVDQWFWSLFEGRKAILPNPATVREYRAAIPDDFKFTVKVPNSITLTHYYKKSKGGSLEANPYFLSVELFQEFLSTLNPMKDVLGAFIFQFEYLNRQKMRSRDEFFEGFETFAGQLPEGFSYAIELRNPNYLTADYFRFLERNNLGHVFLQGYWMPDISSIFEVGRETLVKSKQVVIRLHGGDRKEIEEKVKERWNKIVEPRDKELSSTTHMIKDLLNHEVDVYLNINNHYEGSAPLTIDRIRALLAV